MEKEVVTYEIALKLKELGFNEECILYYTNDKLISEDEFLYHIRNGSPLTYNCNEKSCQTDWINWDGIPIIPTSAPLWQQAIDWLYYKHGIIICVNPHYKQLKKDYQLESFTFSLLNVKLDILGCQSDFTNLFKSREQAILKSIELCQK